MKSEIKIEVSLLEEGIKQICLLGRLDMKNTLIIDTQFSTAVASAEKRVMINLSDLDFLASIGIRLLIANAKALTGQGGLMILYKPSPIVEKILGVTGIDAIIPVFDDFDAALACLRRG
jgi:anti-anti-sigma factor